MKSTIILEHACGELLKKIHEALNENPYTRDQYLSSLREWLRKQPHLPDEWEDACLMSFLRGCKFSLEKCKRKLEMYFTMRTACPEFYSNRNITRPELMYLTTRAQAVTLPRLTPQGLRVTIYRGFDSALDARHLCDAFKIGIMFGDIRLREETTGVAGDVYIIDVSILTVSHMAKVPITVIKKFLICVLEAYPVIIKQIHILNASPVFDMAFKISKTLVKEKLINRVVIHSNVSGLLDYIPKEMLPVDFGGSGESMETLQKTWLQKLHDYIPWFEAQEQIKANESLRPGKPKNYDELFGIDGSFRQLTID